MTISFTRPFVIGWVSSADLAMINLFQNAFRFSHLKFVSLDGYSYGVVSVQCSSGHLFQVGLGTAAFDR